MGIERVNRERRNPITKLVESISLNPQPCSERWNSIDLPLVLWGRLYCRQAELFLDDLTQRLYTQDSGATHTIPATLLLFFWHDTIVTRLFFSLFMGWAQIKSHGDTSDFSSGNDCMSRRCASSRPQWVQSAFDRMNTAGRTSGVSLVFEKKTVFNRTFSEHKFNVSCSLTERRSLLEEIGAISAVFWSF